MLNYNNSVQRHSASSFDPRNCFDLGHFNAAYSMGQVNTMKQHQKMSTSNNATVYNNYSKKLNSLNSSVMDDKYDTYKTANIEINQ
jgi:hypothetical protein